METPNQVLVSFLLPGTGLQIPQHQVHTNQRRHQNFPFRSAFSTTSHALPTGQKNNMLDIQLEQSCCKQDRNP